MLQLSRSRFSFWLPRRGHTTTAEKAVVGSMARPPRLLIFQGFAMDRRNHNQRGGRQCACKPEAERVQADTITHQYRDKTVQQSEKVVLLVVQFNLHNAGHYSKRKQSGEDASAGSKPPAELLLTQQRAAAGLLGRMKPIELHHR